jgi:hypothetical protein
MVWVRERTIPTERPPLVGEVIANYCGYRVPRGQRDGSLRPYSRFSRQEPLLFYQVAPQLYSRGWVDPIPDPLLHINFWKLLKSNCFVCMYINNIFVTWLANVIYVEGWIQTIRKALRAKMTKAHENLGCGKLTSFFYMNIFMYNEDYNNI